jgi:hypothetical protein
VHFSLDLVKKTFSLIVLDLRPIYSFKDCRDVGLSNKFSSLGAFEGMCAASMALLGPNPYNLSKG